MASSLLKTFKINSASSSQGKKITLETLFKEPLVHVLFSVADLEKLENVIKDKQKNTSSYTP